MRLFQAIVLAASCMPMWAITVGNLEFDLPEGKSWKVFFENHTEHMDQVIYVPQETLDGTEPTELFFVSLVNPKVVCEGGVCKLDLNQNPSGEMPFDINSFIENQEMRLKLLEYTGKSTTFEYSLVNHEEEISQFGLMRTILSEDSDVAVLAYISVHGNVAPSLREEVLYTLKSAELIE